MAEMKWCAPFNNLACKVFDREIQAKKASINSHSQAYEYLSIASYSKIVNRTHKRYITSRTKQEVQGPWRSAWQLQLGWHWQFSADLYQKLTAAD